MSREERKPFDERADPSSILDDLGHRLREAPRLLVIVSERGSGTSRLLAEVARRVPLVLIDARPCLAQSRLITELVRCSIAQLVPEAADGWLPLGLPPDGRAQEVVRALEAAGIDVGALRTASNASASRLGDAMRLPVVLGAPRRPVVIDHFGELVADMAPPARRRLLGDVRAVCQRPATADLVLVESPGGSTASALKDPDHPLFLAGQVFDAS